MSPNQILQGAQTSYILVHGLEGAPPSVAAKLAVSRPCTPPPACLPFFWLSVSPGLSFLSSTTCGSTLPAAFFPTYLNFSENFILGFKNFGKIFFLSFYFCKKKIFSLVSKVLTSPVVATMLPFLLGTLVLLVSPSFSQYEQYSFRGFPRSEIKPLKPTYTKAMELYEAQSWKEASRMLEVSLRLHRLLQDSEAFCGQSCVEESQIPGLEEIQGEEEQGDWKLELQMFGRVLSRAVCLRKCKATLPVFQQPYPDKDTLKAFQRRDPYQYLHYTYFKINELEKAVSAAHTFLQKNPTHEMTLRYMNYYKTLLEVDEFLIDLEAQPYEGVFVKAVKSYNAGDFRRSIEDMEQALPLYYKAYDTCLTDCEGVYEMREFKDFYPAVADHLADVLECKVECESNLTPNVGGYFVHKFVATMYHYLQFAYYKLNDVKNAVQCVSSYMLFDPTDNVMQQNLAYYKFYKEKWDLEDTDFNPREEALRYHNQTTRHKELLQFSKDFLHRDDDEIEIERLQDTDPPPSDAEFEGEGDYEEGIFSEKWTQPKSKGDVAEKSEGL